MAEPVKLKILVVDDEEHIRSLLASGLAMNGHDVVTAADGLEGCEKAETEKPDVILLDVKMPRMDGWEACRRLRATPATRQVPILILTAFNQAEDCQKSIEAGANLFIAKPFHVREVLDAIQKLLNLP